MKNVILSDGTIFMNVTDKAKEIWNAGIFELFSINVEEETERAILDSEELNKAIEDANVYIECGHLNTILL